MKIYLGHIFLLDQKPIADVINGSFFSGLLMYITVEKIIVFSVFDAEAWLPKPEMKVFFVYRWNSNSPSSLFEVYF